MALNDEMSAVFKSSRTDLDSVPDNTVGVDPESGNEIPLGSLPEEVRDDIPAQLSEGEYVVPADVVRYYGVKFFEDLRAEAKFGYQDMEENGRIGGEPAGMEMVDPEDDMMFDISELEVMEVPDEEPVGAFFGGFFGGGEKEKSPEEKVRERFKEVDKREKQKRTVVKNADGTTKTVYSSVGGAGVDDDGSNSDSSQPNFDGPSIAEQINFGGDYSDKPKKEKKKSNKAVRKAYTASPKDIREQQEQQQGTNLLENKPDAMGNLMNALGFNEGGYALNPGDPGYDEMGSLGLGSEGVGLGTGEENVNAVEMVAYVHEDGRVIYILHINGVPQNEVPSGFFPRTDEENTEEEDSTYAAVEGSQAVAQSDDDGPDFAPAPEGIDYDKLTLDEMAEMLEDQQSPKMNVIATGIGALNPIMGLVIKGAMMHQARSLRKEMERRLGGELTTQDRTRLEGLLKQSQESNSILKKIIDGFKDDEETEAAEAYTPEVAAGSVTLPTTPKPEGMLETSTDDLVKAFAPPEPFAMEEYKRKKMKEAQQKVDNPPTVEYSQSGTDDVIQAMQDRDAPQAAISAAQKEAEKVQGAVSDINRGVQRGFKKGGLASKKKK